MVLGCSWEWFEQRACLFGTGEVAGFLRLPQGHWQSLDLPLRETACGSQHLPMAKLHLQCDVLWSLRLRLAEALHAAQKASHAWEYQFMSASCPSSLILSYFARSSCSFTFPQPGGVPARWASVCSAGKQFRSGPANMTEDSLVKFRMGLRSKCSLVLFLIVILMTAFHYIYAKQKA